MVFVSLIPVDLSDGEVLYLWAWLTALAQILSSRAWHSSRISPKPGLFSVNGYRRNFRILPLLARRARVVHVRRCRSAAPRRERPSSTRTWRVRSPTHALHWMGYVKRVDELCQVQPQICAKQVAQPLLHIRLSDC